MSQRAWRPLFRCTNNCPRRAKRNSSTGF